MTSQLRSGKLWQNVIRSYKTPNDIHVSPVSVSIARMLLHASWVPASISGDPEPKRKLTKSCQLVNSQDSQFSKVQGAVAIVSKIEIWPLSSLEIDNKIKIDQVIPSVLIAKKGERKPDI